MSSALIASLKDEDPKVRARAAQKLGRSGDESVVPELIAALSDSHEKVCLRAVQSLGELGDKRAVTALKRILGRTYFTPHSSNAFVRKHAAIALGKTGDKRSVAVLIKALDDRCGYVVCEAAGALGLIGDARAIPHLEERLDGYNYNPHSDDPDIEPDLSCALWAIKERCAGPSADSGP